VTNQAHKPSKQDPSESGCVDRCACVDITFDTIKQAAAGSEDDAILAAHKATGCGGDCGLCLPYIRLMLQTGRTKFPPMTLQEFSDAGVNPSRTRAILRQITRQQSRMDSAQTRDENDENGLN